MKITSTVPLNYKRTLVTVNSTGEGRSSVQGRVIKCDRRRKIKCAGEGDKVSKRREIKFTGTVITSDRRREIKSTGEGDKCARRWRGKGD